MATTQHATLPVNGNYHAHDGYAASANEDHSGSQAHLNSTALPSSGPTPGTFGSQNADAPSMTSQGTGPNNNHTEVPKDEVGWYFVEQYYTNLSRCPDKLHVSGSRVFSYNPLHGLPVKEMFPSSGIG